MTGQLNIPEVVLQAQRDRELVLFVGAGASMAPPSSLPDFTNLAIRIAHEVGSTVPLEATKEPWRFSPDQFLTRLEDEGRPVHERIHRLVEESDSPNSVHAALVRLFPSVADVRIVTTNYDEHLTLAAQSFFGQRPEVYRAPALPLGRDFAGIVHLHGGLGGRPRDLVATYADFGRAYLTDAWAARFLQEMFRKFTVLFVGYSHNDLIMKYLGRGLPPGTKRFGLLSGTALGEWPAMGITAVTYPKDQHDVLTAGLQRWADLSRWGLLEHEQQIIQWVAASGGAGAGAGTDPLLPEDPARLSYLEWVFSQEGLVGLFTRHAKDPAWLSWASSQPAFVSLFRSAPVLDNVGTELAWWFGQDFAAKFAGEALTVVRRHGGLLHPQTAQEVARALTGQQPGAPVIGGWVPVLIRSGASGAVLSWLLGSLAWAEHRESVLLLLDHLTAPQPQLIPSFASPDAVRFDVDALAGEEWALRQAWDRLRPHLDEVAPRVLPGVERHLRNAYLASSAGRGTPGFDARSLQRSAIDPHAQDSPPTGFDLLVDIARDCSAHLASTVPGHVASTLESWVAGDVPFLQRLAVHGWNARTDVSADDKLRWLLTNNLVYTTVAKHEVFRLIATALPDAGHARHDLLDRILAGPHPANGNTQHDEHRAYAIYNLLTWVCRHDASFTEAQRALNDLQAAHPDFGPRAAPDLDITFRSISFQSPISTAQLPSMTSDEDIDWLLTYQGPLTPDSFADRWALLSTVTETAAEDHAWGVTIASALIARGEWQNDLWPCLLGGWRRASLDLSEEHTLAALVTLGRLNTETSAGQIRAATTGILVAMANRQEAVGPVLDACEILASALVDAGRSDEPVTQAAGLSEDWACDLAEFWVRAAVQRWNAVEENLRTGLPESSGKALAALVDPRHPHRLPAIATLGHHLTVLIAMDEEWSVAQLLPAFVWTADPDAALAAWTGYLSSRRWNERVLELLRPSLLQSFTHLQGDKLRPALIDHLGDLCLDSASAAQPDEGILTAFLHDSNDDERDKWAQHVGWRLAAMQPAEAESVWTRWIMDYWTRRLDALPLALTEHETAHMLGWVLPAGRLLPRAVDLLGRSPSRFTHASPIFQKLKESPALTDHPVATARLAAHVLTHLQGQVSGCEEIGSVFHTLLVTGDPALVPDLKRICEGAAQAGCKDALTWVNELP
jgi:Domain of unknown function (DUF4020)/SIR2-like domain